MSAILVSNPINPENTLAAAVQIQQQINSRAQKVCALGDWDLDVETEKIGLVQ